MNKKWYAYKSYKPDKKYYVITHESKKHVLGLLACLILQNIRTKQQNKDTLIGIEKMKIRINQVWILLAGGV